MVKKIDYLNLYHLERYLLEDVGPRFRSSGKIDSTDLFMILAWKSNRAKTRVRDKIKSHAKGSFKEAVLEIAKALSAAKDHKERLGVLMRDWGLRLPMASAILTILYPEYFTIYDVRVCGVLNIKYKGGHRFSDTCWKEYKTYKDAVCKSTPSHLNLRDKDRFLWGKSFWADAKRDAQ
jgi:hypothetical protein